MSKSYIWSALFALAIIGWFGSGYIMPAAGTAGSAATPKQAAKEEKTAPFKVAASNGLALTIVD